jgi:membrane protease YdiL (CAAX protease family)
MIKKRNLILTYVLVFFTYGIYFIYWLVSTKNNLNELGAKIPTAWLLIVPFANIYWIYKYSEGFSLNLKKDNNTIRWFLLFLFLGGIVMPGFVQSELNKIA